MAVRALLQRGDPGLKAENARVTDVTAPYVIQAITDMIDTMRDQQLIGIAAPQIGHNLRVFVTEPRVTTLRPVEQSDDLRVYINPEIIAQSADSVLIWEGCGCVQQPSVFGPLTRPRTVTVKALDQRGAFFTVKADGILGRVIQHEHDHLDGKEFLDLITDTSQLLPREEYLARIKPLASSKESARITVKEVVYL